MLTYIKLLATSLFWGGTFVAGRILSAQVPPFTGAFLRFCLASLFLLGIYALELRQLHKQGANTPFIPPLTPKQWLGLVLLALTGIALYNYFFLAGLHDVPAGRSAVIVAMNPVLTALVACFFFRERISPLGGLGIVLSVAGAITALTAGKPWTIASTALTHGDAIIFCATLCWSAYTLTGKVMLRGMTPLASVTFSCILGALLLLPASLREGMPALLPTLGLAQWLAAAFLAVFGTVISFVWFAQGIRALGAARAAIFINFVPIAGILLGWLVLKETLSPFLFLGAAMVGIGVYLLNKHKNAS